MSVSIGKCQSFNITTYKNMLIGSYSLQCFIRHSIFSPRSQYGTPRMKKGVSVEVESGN